MDPVFLHFHQKVMNRNRIDDPDNRPCICFKRLGGYFPVFDEVSDDFLYVDHPDNMVFISIDNRIPCELFVMDELQEGFERIILGKRNDFRPRDHDFLGNPVIKLEYLVYILKLRLVDFTTFIAFG
ncbi:Uncharacterised protein [Mycobacteroides abscessus subsp. abscessus]|nr:Uncharacterised protein [Mycobacteroides abscessus subsp. abscessus]